MAGLGALDDLYNTFLGQTNDALGAQDSPWQQELMESVNPDKVKRQNIMRAIAQASQTLATTPGDFLSGISAAVGSGANSYLQAQDGAQQDRLQAMRVVQAAQQQQQDRRLQLLHDALGVGRDIRSDARADRQEQRQAKYDDARTEYYRKGKTGSGMSGADAALERKRGTAATMYFRQLDKLREDNFGEEPSEEQKDNLWNEIQRRYKIPDDTPPDEEGVPTSENSATVQQGDVAAAAPGGILPAEAPPPLEQRIVGKIYATPKGNFTWTGQGWKPAI